MNEELKQKIRDAVADAYLGSNTEFVRQLRAGEQDDGPLIQMAFVGARTALESK